MKTTSSLLLVFASLALALNSQSAERSAPTDPVIDRLFPPDLILHNGEAIGLSDEKRNEILARLEKAQARFQDLEQTLVKEREAMIALLDRENQDEALLLKQLDRVSDREKDLKREQFALVLGLRNLLTKEQQTRLKALRTAHNFSEVESRLKGKLSRIESGVQKLADAGDDPSSIAEKMQPFPELMRVGKVKEAEELLDRVLKEIEKK